MTSLFLHSEALWYKYAYILKMGVEFIAPGNLLLRFYKINTNALSKLKHQTELMHPYKGSTPTMNLCYETFSFPLSIQRHVSNASNNYIAILK